MNRTKYLIKNTTIFAVGNLSTKLIAFFLLPLYTYVLSTEEYGTIDLVFTICNIIIPIIMFNVGEAVMRYSLDKDANHDQILSTATVIIAFGYILGLLIIPIINKIDLINDYYIYIYAYIMFSATNVVLLCYLRGLEKLVSYTICNVFNSLSIAVLNVFYLVILKQGIKGYLMAYILAFFMTNILAIILGKHYRVFKYIQINKKLSKNMLGFSLALVPNSLLWWVTNSSDRIMVTSMISASANGLYSVSYKIPSLMTMLSTIFMHAWQYSAIKEKDSKDKEEYNNIMFDRYLRFIILVATSLLLIIKPLLKILVSEEFYVSWKYSPFLILGFVFMSLGTFVGTSYYVEKNMVGNMISALAGAVANVILNFILIPIIGANGAAIATCISFIIIFIYRVIDTRKYLKLEIRKKEYLVLLGMTLIMVFSIYIENYIGYITMLADYLLILFLYKSYIKDIIRKGTSYITKKLKSRKKTAGINI